VLRQRVQVRAALTLMPLGLPRWLQPRLPCYLPQVLVLVMVPLSAGDRHMP